MKFYNDKTVLITGASGYIATALIEELVKCSNNIIRVSRSKLNRKEKCKDIQGDISKKEIWYQLLPDVDIIFHLAAQTSFYKAADNPEEDFISNFIPIKNILEASIDIGNSPFIVFSGSATQVGLPSSLPVNESHRDEPLTFYDLHKLLSEQLLEGYIRQGLARGTTLRLANIYGPGTNSSSKDRGILNRMVSRGLKGEAITIYGDGSPIRDYLFISDLVYALLAAGENQSLLNGKHFVIGYGEGISIFNAFHLVAKRILEIKGLNVDIVSIQNPEGLSSIESRDFVADNSSFRSLTKWSPTVNLSNGIDKIISSMTL